MMKNEGILVTLLFRILWTNDFLEGFRVLMFAIFLCFSGFSI